MPSTNRLQLARDAYRAYESGDRELIESLLADDLVFYSPPDPGIDRLWAKEAEERLAAYRRGEIKAVPLQEVLAKYRAK